MIYLAPEMKRQFKPTTPPYSTYLNIAGVAPPPHPQNPLINSYCSLFYNIVFSLFHPDLYVIPHDKGSIPHNSNVMPHDRGSIPHNSNVMPHDKESMPHNSIAIPHDRGSVPHNSIVMPHNKENS